MVFLVGSVVSRQLRGGRWLSPRRSDIAVSTPHLTLCRIHRWRWPTTCARQGANPEPAQQPPGTCVIGVAGVVFPEPLTFSVTWPSSGCLLQQP
jgi:hypothetical protein